MVHRGVAPLVLVPDFTMSTELARSLQPAQVPHEDAVFNVSRSALLVAALTQSPELLFEATEDRLHQNYRGEAMPLTRDLIGALRAAGHAAVVSGAGPSILVLASGPAERLAAAKVAEAHGGGFRDQADFSDFFSSIFGSGAGPGRGSARGGFQMRGDDRQVRIQISLTDAYAGNTRTLTLANPAIDVRGEVREARKTVNVTIPRGVTEGQRIRLAGQGGAGFGGGPNGDLFLEIEFEPHPLFHADGRDIHLELPITPWEAALGAKVKAPTLGGTVEITVTPNTQAGRRLRLAGRGLPGKVAGDQFVTLRIVTPPADTDTARDFYRHMAETLPFDPRATLTV